MMALKRSGFYGEYEIIEKKDNILCFMGEI